MLSVDFNFMQAPKSNANPETAGSIASNNTSSNSSSSSSFCAIA